MRARPIQPARIAFTSLPGEPPTAPDFGDLYHPHVGALAQARHVFLHGNGLPQRWAGRADFVILETGFGLGNNFLATWDAWRKDPQRCERLHLVSIERHPPTHQDLVRAHGASPLPELAAALLAAWPALTPNLHLLDFEQGRVQLTLALGDVALMLPALRLAADAIYLDGFSPACNPEMWTPRVLKAVGRLAAPGATAATWSVARTVQSGLVSAGFELEQAAGIGGKRQITVARWAPRHTPRRLPSAAVSVRSAVVVGAGLAGAAVAQALARQGLAVTVLEALPGPALATSGNPAGIFHGTVNPDDGPYARLYRAAALAAAVEYRQAMRGGAVTGQIDGLLRLAAPGLGLADLQAVLQRLGLPAGYVQAIDAQAASGLAGVPLRHACWYYPGGGWLAPADWVRTALAAPGVSLRTGAHVQRLLREDSTWCLLDAQGAELARSPLVVLANAAQAGPLLQALGHSPWPVEQTRGQVTHGAVVGAVPLRLPVAGDGYAVSTPHGLLCGATRQADDTDPDIRQADHLLNLARLRSLTGLEPKPETGHWQGRVAWRLHADDRMPIAGPVPLISWPARPGGQRMDQPRLVPREPGLFVLTALGARGLSLAPLLGRLVAAQATGTPWPLEQDLADAVDPARWIVRAARQPG